MKKFNEIMLPQMREKNKVETLSRTVNNYFTVIGTDGVGEPEDHYEQLETLKHASAGETFIATFSSNPGGAYSGILAWKNALEMTEAHTIAILEGDLASAGTIIPLYFNECHVTPYTTFMCHSANFGVARNTALNVEANAVFQAKQIKRFIRDAYKHFLTEDEILKILDGSELYLDEFEIQERLTRRAELMAAEAEEGCDCGQCSLDACDNPNVEKINIRITEGLDDTTTLTSEEVGEKVKESLTEEAKKRAPAKKKAPVKKASPKKTK